MRWWTLPDRDRSCFPGGDAVQTSLDQVKQQVPSNELSDLVHNCFLDGRGQNGRVFHQIEDTWWHLSRLERWRDEGRLVTRGTAGAPACRSVLRVGSREHVATGGGTNL